MTVEGNRSLLGQAMSNLLENALRHTPEGSEITLRVAREGEAVLLEVADTGHGIPEAEREKVLRRLYRLERSRTTPGHGLGLSLVAAIAGFHGAELSLADNAPGLRVSLRFRAA
ncbi:sensor histidine kinase [Seohaeicola zhoushanensis]